MYKLIRFTQLAILVAVSCMLMSFKIKQPIKGWLFYESKSKTYKAGVENLDGKSAAFIESTKAKRVARAILATETFKADKYLGKRIRLSAYIKTQDVTGSACLGMFTVGDSSDIYTYRSDDMKDRLIKGTTDWKKYQIVLDVPKDGITIGFSLSMDSTGKAWISNLKLEEVDTTIPTTGHQFTQKNWWIEQDNNLFYSSGIDSTCKWNGEPTYHFKSTKSIRKYSIAAKYLSPKAYLGEKIKITAYIKTTGIKKGQFYHTSTWYYAKYTEKCSTDKYYKLKPEQDWTKYETVLYIPANSSELIYTINLDDKGEIWVNNFKIEMVSDNTPISNKMEKKYPAPSLFAEGPTLEFVANK